jgi:predicted protein tyrosine phosphatase
MREVHDRLYVGGADDCFEGGAGWVVVHACRHPCHRLAVARLGLEERQVVEEGSDLFLDLVDAPVPPPSSAPFTAFLAFAAASWRRGEHLLVHCNQGLSRAPGLALLLLARRLGALPAGSYDEAAGAFSALYPAYSPGRGIRSFLDRRWHDL